MQPTLSFVIGKCRELLADKPPEVQLKFLWLLFEALAADTDQMKAYTDAMHKGISNYVDTVKTYPKAHANRLAADMESLMEELAQSIQERGGERG